MKLYEYIKKEKEKIIKLCGIIIFKQIIDYKTDEKYQEILNGLISTAKLKSLKNDSSKKEIKILGKTIITRIEENNSRIYYFLNKIIKKVSWKKNFKRLYFKNFNKKHDDIYILRGNSGEIYLTLTFIIDVLIKKNNSKKPLLIATQKYHIDMIKMICPDLSHIYLENLDLKINGDSFIIDNFRFFILYDAIHFREVELNIKNDTNGEKHYFEFILNKFDIKKENLNMRKINIQQCAEKSMMKKVNKIGLNIDNFVFIAPEAQSCKLYDINFWNTLIEKLQELGFDVFCNLVKKEINLNDKLKFKTCDLNFEEAFALAKKSKKIISLRSGFTEFLLQTNVPIDVLYTEFKHRAVFNDMSCEQVISGFGLSKLPFINSYKIQEFNTTEISLTECISKILNNNL